MPSAFVLLGTQTDDAGNSLKVGVPLADFTTHGFVVGTTGSGKSTFLRNLAVQTFGLGASTAVIEPHGDLCLDLLSAVPDAFLNRVVYLEVDSLQPPSIPLMTLGLGAGQDAALDAAMSVIRMAEPASWDQSTRMREVLRNTARVILDALGWQASLLAVDRFLSDGETNFRERILSRVSEENSKARDFCRYEVAACLEGDKRAAGMRDSILGAQRRLETFVTDRRLRRTMALPPLGPAVSLRHLLSGGKLVLLPVNSAKLGGKAAGLVSMLFMQMAKTAFLGRVEKSDRQQAALIIDEFAAMAGAETGGGEVAEITNALLAEARKFGASVILATQSASQLTPEVAKRVQINTNLKIILLVSDPDEARQAAQILGSDLVNETDIRSLPKYHGYVKAMVNKAPKPPCMIQMLPPQSLAAPPWTFSSEPEPPQVSDLWERVRGLAHTAADPDDPSGATEVVRFLRGLSPSDWEQVVADAQAWNQYHAARLLAAPSIVPDRVERAKRISRALYGLPWWLREAHYWRERDEGHRVGRPKKEDLQKDAGENDLLAEM
ncbi:MAG: type IV secretion system DNA-binding domain-containing protein [Anaerolineales bacterium]|nr:type IV secretion system DNA-binding domain-containing protein [Anaerolineales bacterium]